MSSLLADRFGLLIKCDLVMRFPKSIRIILLTTHTRDLQEGGWKFVYLPIHKTWNSRPIIQHKKKNLINYCFQPNENISNSSKTIVFVNNLWELSIRFLRRLPILSLQQKRRHVLLNKFAFHMTSISNPNHVYPRYKDL